MSEIPQIDATRADGLNRDDFVTKDEAGYHYPFQSKERDFTQLENDPWPDSLDESCRGEDGIYREDGFNLQVEVATAPGPILEVGGPTTDGYEFLDDVPLPTKPIMTNVIGNRPERRGADSLVAVDKLALNALMDVRRFPVADESLGMIVGANLTQLDREATAGIMHDKTLDYPGKEAAIGAAVEVLQKEALESAASGDPQRVKAIERSESPLIATIAQAARTLKPNGLFVLHSLGPEETSLAKSLGLELVMHTPMTRGRTPYSEFPYLREAVFRKTTKQ